MHPLIKNKCVLRTVRIRLYDKEVGSKCVLYPYRHFSSFLKSIWDLGNLGKFWIGLGIGHFGGVFTQKPLVTVSDSCNIPLWIIRIFRLTKASPFFLSMTCKNCSFKQKLNSQPALKLSQPCIQTNNKIWVVYINMASKTLF